MGLGNVPEHPIDVPGCCWYNGSNTTAVDQETMATQPGGANHHRSWTVVAHLGSIHVRAVGKIPAGIDGRHGIFPYLATRARCMLWNWQKQASMGK
jgi:hypothetical protein